MKPEIGSRVLLAVTRSKAKMYEYGLPESEHIRLARDPSRLLRLAVGMLGDLAAVASDNGGDSTRLKELSSSLRFSARYFDAYAAARLVPARDAHLLLLASAAYYLCDLPGSASVLVSRLSNDIDIDAAGLERLLFWLLRGNLSIALREPAMPRYRSEIREVSRSLSGFFELAPGDIAFLKASASLRRIAYQEGTPRELLLADVCSAIINRRVECSARKLLPQYSGLPLEHWMPALAKRSFLRELWPAQRLLGEKGVFGGESAIVQMPTSAGKSRATELIIRSAFLSGRASLAVIVAPFRALCHEIRETLGRAFRGEQVSVNELSDVFQTDFVVEELVSGKSILVMTPEKLVYVLRHAPELADRIGLLVLDEGHQFDTGARGVTYELLVTSLKKMIPATAQKILISAVITNASQISLWLTGDTDAVVSGSELLPTERSVAFTSWDTQLGQLHFVSPDNPDEEEFFVPRIIKSTPLAVRPRESPRQFPEKGDSQSVALYLALTLVRNGAAAIFCGRKDTANGLCELLVDIAERGPPMPMPSSYSDPVETERVAMLYERNLGSGASSTRAARLGAFTHHGNTPHGVRLAVENAMKEGLGRLVLCTSTLAQGVNLPIRYLIVTSAQQGGERIKVRDFHNLMGRAGRSGMHTEGSVLFANPEVYDSRQTPESRWPEFKALLQVRNSEPCASSLLSVLDPLRSDGGRVSLAVDPLAIAQAYVEDQDGSEAWIAEGATQLARKYFSQEGLVEQLENKRDIFAAVESFLLAHWQDSSDPSASAADPVEQLAKRTLAYHLASDEQRALLSQLFGLLAGNVRARVGEADRRRVYGRTLFGIGDTAALEKWVADNEDRIAECRTEEDLLAAVWPAIAARIDNDTFRKWRPVETTELLARGWIAGESFGVLHDRMLAAGVRIGLGQRPRKPKVGQVVEMGENALAYDGAHVLGAICELFEFLSPEVEESPVSLLQSLQKRLKYGLPSGTPIVLHEAGFSDRPLALELATVLPVVLFRSDLANAIREQTNEVTGVLERYPRYFTRVFNRLLSS